MLCRLDWVLKPSFRKDWLGRIIAYLLCTYANVVQLQKQLWNLRFVAEGCWSHHIFLYLRRLCRLYTSVGQFFGFAITTDSRFLKIFKVKEPPVLGLLGFWKDLQWFMALEFWWKNLWVSLSNQQFRMGSLIFGEPWFQVKTGSLIIQRTASQGSIITQTLPTSSLFWNQREPPTQIYIP